jgi:hypothetical protein
MVFQRILVAANLTALGGVARIRHESTERLSGDADRARRY